MKKEAKNISAFKAKGKPQGRLRSLLVRLKDFQFKHEVKKTTRTVFGFRGTDD